ncbi:ABC transporter substrate-binding protein [Pseudoduganella namucuonensis]|uniref:Iron(III) transport system substrate-binding protein n=1 Tax=Pseudoduganella namucuonensis TaxID=1035707 RepID=A0A1I7LVR4_9BURK|nr:ABC transporter substrate-binding protein [Pseudoduganella namucuonensis]SFV13794.1 iron(III) transport system substrate-binding protein [Pseudoduganella namucuonensis]
MKPSLSRLALPALLASVAAPALAADAGSLNIICGVQAEWCSLVQTTFSRTTGIKVNLVAKGGGEALAQISAESANPKTDVWFGGTGDPHLQAAEKDLTLAYQSPNINLLRDWAVNQAKQSGYKTVGIYSGPLGIAYNTELLAKKKLAAPLCWTDLIQPQYKGEVQMANPNSSGTAYMAIATLVQITGEDKAFEYLKALHKNISQYPRSGSGPLKNVSHGENTIAVGWIHDVPGEVMQGFPVKSAAPCEGTGYEVGSMSIVKGARNLANAKKFYDWALTAPAQELGLAAKQFQLPANTAAKVDPRVPDVKRIKLINYDFAKYGKAAERKRLLERWEKEVNGGAN